MRNLQNIETPKKTKLFFLKTMSNIAIFCASFINYISLHWRYSIENGFIKNLAKFAEKYKWILKQVFSCEFWKIFRKTLLTEQLSTTPSATLRVRSINLCKNKLLQLILITDVNLWGCIPFHHFKPVFL